MQKFVYLILAVASIAFVVSFFLFPKTEVREVEKKVNVPLPAVQPSSPAAPIFEVKKKEIKVTKAPKKNIEEPTNVAHFEVKEGFAVAYHDIILGIPEEEGLAEGEYEMPLVEYWDKPEIPYAIEAEVPNKERILTALKHIETKTGMKFIPFEGHKDAILFQKGKEHCLSALGRRGGMQPIRLSDKCAWNEITHEILHSLGFIHEQSRPDRDKYVQVQWENIEGKYVSQFEMMPYEFMGPAKDTDFDYESIMLYGTHFFVKESHLINMKSLTSIPIAPSSTGLSLGDIKRLKKQYRLD